MNKKIRMFNAGGKVTTDDLIDPDEVMLDEDGNPLTDDDDDLIPPGGNPSGDDDDDDDDPPAGGEDDNDDDDKGEEPVNHADYVLRSLGYETKQIDLGDGNIKDVADLTPEEQLEVVTGRLEEVVSFYNTKLEEVQNGGGFKNDVEKLVIETLRDTDYSLGDLAKIIADNDPAALAKTASNEDLVRKHLEKTYPDFSKEDIDEELESMAGTSRFERLASKLRESMMNQKIEAGDLSKAISSFRDQDIQKKQADFNQEVQGIKGYVTALKEFNGVPVTEDVKNYLASELIAESVDSDSKFIQSMNSPERLFRLAFLDKFHDQLIDQVANHYFELGKQEADKVISKFNKKPDAIVTGGSRFKAAGKSSSKANTEEDEF